MLTKFYHPGASLPPSEELSNTNDQEIECLMISVDQIQRTVKTLTQNLMEVNSSLELIKKVSNFSEVLNAQLYNQICFIFNLQKLKILKKSKDQTKNRPNNVKSFNTMVASEMVEKSYDHIMMPKNLLTPEKRQTLMMSTLPTYDQSFSGISYTSGIDICRENHASIDLSSEIQPWVKLSYFLCQTIEYLIEPQMFISQKNMFC